MTDDDPNSSDLSDDEDGRRKYPEQDFIDAIEQGELPTTSEIAEDVGCLRQSALYRLNQLEDEGTVSSKLVGNTKVWSLMDS